MGFLPQYRLSLSRSRDARGTGLGWDLSIYTTFANVSIHQLARHTLISVLSSKSKLLPLRIIQDAAFSPYFCRFGYHALSPRYAHTRCYPCRGQFIASCTANCFSADTTFTAA